MNTRLDLAGDVNEPIIFVKGFLISFIITRLNEKIPGFNIINNKLNREEIIYACNESSIKLQTLSSKIPTLTNFRIKNNSFHSNNGINTENNWKKWKLERICSQVRML